MDDKWKKLREEASRKLAQAHNAALTCELAGDFAEAENWRIRADVLSEMLRLLDRM